MPRRDTRVAFFNVDLTVAIESPPWGTEHRYYPSQQKWASTPGYWEPVLGSFVTRRSAHKFTQAMVEHHKHPATRFLVLYKQVGPDCVQLAALKTEDSADDLHQLSNCNPPAWWRNPPQPKPPPKPSAWDKLMGEPVV